MNLNKEDLERLSKNSPEDTGPLPETSYVYDDAVNMITKLNLYRTKKLYTNLDEKTFHQKLEKEFSKLFINFPSIFEKIFNGTLEVNRLKYMLAMINKIKDNKISKHKASVAIGQELVDNIIKPSLK